MISASPSHLKNSLVIMIQLSAWSSFFPSL